MLAANSSLNSRGHFIGVEVGPAIIRAGVFSGSLQFIGKTKFTTKVERGPEAVMERIARCIRYAADECDLSMEQIAGVGIGIPGQVNEPAGTVTLARELAWENVPLRCEMEKQLKLPVFTGQIHNFGALGIYARETKCNSRCFVALFLGAQIGGGIIRDGKLESLEELKRTDRTFEALDLNIFASLEHPEFGQFRSRDFRKALRKGNELVREFVRQIATECGRIAARVTSHYSPDTIAIGGGMLDEMNEEIMKIVEETFQAKGNRPQTSSPVFLPSTLGELAVVTGAANWASQKIAATANTNPCAAFDVQQASTSQA